MYIFADFKDKKYFSILLHTQNPWIFINSTSEFSIFFLHELYDMISKSYNFLLVIEHGQILTRLFPAQFEGLYILAFLQQGSK